MHRTAPGSRLPLCATTVASPAHSLAWKGQQYLSLILPPSRPPAAEPTAWGGTAHAVSVTNNAQSHRHEACFLAPLSIQLLPALSSCSCPGRRSWAPRRMCRGRQRRLDQQARVGAGRRLPLPSCAVIAPSCTGIVRRRLLHASLEDENRQAIIGGFAVTCLDSCSMLRIRVLELDDL